MKNFSKLTHDEQIVELLNCAFDLPLDQKLLPLSLLWTIDKTMSEKILKETEDNYTLHHYNQIIMNHLLDHLKKDLVEQQ